MTSVFLRYVAAFLVSTTIVFSGLKAVALD